MNENLRTWLELEALKLGTANQRERWLAEVLPEDEMCQLARAELFKGFENLKRWAGRDGAALRALIRHRDCSLDDYSHLAVEYGIVPLHHGWPQGLSADEWNMLRKIQGLVEALKVHPWIVNGRGDVHIDCQMHSARCTRCGADKHAASAKVTISWAGRELVREYALDPR
jgi:hypothetical protein